MSEKRRLIDTSQLTSSRRRRSANCQAPLSATARFILTLRSRTHARLLPSFLSNRKFLHPPNHLTPSFCHPLARSDVLRMCGAGFHLHLIRALTCRRALQSGCVAAKTGHSTAPAESACDAPIAFDMVPLQCARAGWRQASSSAARPSCAYSSCQALAMLLHITFVYAAAAPEAQFHLARDALPEVFVAFCLPLPCSSPHSHNLQAQLHSSLGARAAARACFEHACSKGAPCSIFF